MSKRTQRSRERQRRHTQSRARRQDGKPGPANSAAMPRHGESTLLWHYTTGQCSIGIIESGVIRVATEKVPASERPIVWFSSNQEWEPTSTKYIITPDGSSRSLSKDELEEGGNGLVRFGVTQRTAKLDWTAIKRLSGMSRSTARHLKVKGRRLGSQPEWWFGSFDSVQRSEWVAIDVLDEGQWVRVFRDGERVGRCA